MVLGILTAASLPAVASSRSHGSGHSHGGGGTQVSAHYAGHSYSRAGWTGRSYARHGRGGRSYAYAGGYGGGLQCVPFARNASGIELSGNAWTWWDEAAGRYERGNTPEPGSILSFSSNGAMRLGHVAVVSRVVNAREIEIDHANWGGFAGRVARGISVVDVSPGNNWTAVRVELGAGDFGSIYPTHGFIYGRPDGGTMVAARSVPAPQATLDPAPRDLRPTFALADVGGFEEVAEAPSPHHLHHRSKHHRH